MIVKNIRLDIDTERVLFRLGYKRGKPLDGKTLDKIKSAIEYARVHIEPAYTYKEVELFIAGERIIIEKGETIISKNLAKLFRNSRIMTLFFATIGGSLEEEIKKNMKGDNEVDGVILDAVGSEYVEKLAEVVERNTAVRAGLDGCEITRRFSPGYGDLALSNQELFFALTDAGKIGIRLTDSMIMLPEKSVSAVIGWEKK